jgi:hypothetical protein
MWCSFACLANALYLFEAMSVPAAKKRERTA